MPSGFLSTRRTLHPNILLCENRCWSGLRVDIVARAGALSAKKKRPGAGAQGLLRVTHREDEGSPAGVIDLLHTDCSASNATDVGAANAEIAQFAIAHAVQFSDSLTILAPIVQRACNVHGLIPRFGSPVAWDQLGFVF